MGALQMGTVMQIDNPVSKSFEPAMWAIATFLSAVMVSFAWLS